MTATPKRLIEGSLLTAAIATYYTAPAAAAGPPPVLNTKCIIKKLTFTNIDTAATHLVTVYLVVGGGAAGNANKLWDQQPIGPQQTVDCFEAEEHVLEPGDTLQAVADLANEINIIASGLEIT